MVDSTTTTKDNLKKAGQAVSAAASNVADTVSNAADVFGNRMHDAACSATKGAEAAASYVGEKVGDATTAVGSQLRSAGGVIRQNAPQEGRWGQASEMVAKTFEDTGSYVEEQGLEGMTRDLANLVRRNPIPSLLIGVGLAIWLTRAMVSNRS